MLETELYTALTASTLITTYTSNRIYPVKLPQTVVFPCISYQRVSGSQFSGLQGYYDLENPTIQIDVWSTSYNTSKTIADNVHSVLDAATAFKAQLISDTDLYENDLELFRVSMDFSCWDRA